MGRSEWRVPTKHDPPGGGTGKPLQYLCQENSMGRNTRQKDMTLEDDRLRSESVQHATEEELMKWLGLSRKDAQLWTCLEVKGKSDAAKKNIIYLFID